MLQQSSLNKGFEESFKQYWNLSAMSDFKGESFSYQQLAIEIAKLHILFEEAGIEKGDKIAICGRNQSRWGIAFLASLTYGAVVVPILHEFHPEQIHSIVKHSESRLMFVGDIIWKKLDAEKMPDLVGIINNTDFDAFVSRSQKLTEAVKNVNLLFGKKYPKSFTVNDVHYHKDQPDELALINYTSGTTSNSKGVMIPYRALWSNVLFAQEVFRDYGKPGDNMVSILPMAHTYGMSFDFLYEISSGLHTTFLTTMPTPALILQAFQTVKPVALICVPMIIEKIVRKGILPKVNKKRVKVLMKTPVVGTHIKKQICEGLKNALGGNINEVVIGGSALNSEIEALLHEIGFNYTVGFGATECAPIIAYEDWKNFVPGSCGRAVPRMTIKIDSKKPHKVPGEILAKGMNTMLGYYKNEELTAQTLTNGWYHTGDLGIMDKNGNVFIKGRIKNMILGANGQNIYPEEIEDPLLNMPYVQECLVVKKEEKLVGLVYPDMDMAKKQGLSSTDIRVIMDENLTKLNLQLPNYERLSEIRIQDVEFEKTPKKSIKRFLYE